MSTDLRRWRAALFTVFALQGIAFASWVTRTPAIRDALGAGTAQMGLVLLGLSVGSMTGILNSPRAVGRVGDGLAGVRRARPVRGWHGGPRRSQSTSRVPRSNVPCGPRCSRSCTAATAPAPS